MSSPRHERRIADLHRLLSILLQREVEDPRAMGVTITRVEESRKGRMLNVWVHRPNCQDREACIAVLQRLVPHFRFALRRALPGRKIPDLTFAWDDALDQAQRVILKLSKLGKKQ